MINTDNPSSILLITHHSFNSLNTPLTMTILDYLHRPQEPVAVKDSAPEVVEPSPSETIETKPEVAAEEKVVAPVDEVVPAPVAAVEEVSALSRVSMLIASSTAC